VAATASPAPPMIKGSVAPLRAGQGTAFLLRRLHSLSGIVPIGAFLVEHFISNAFATRGPAAYAKQVEFLSSFPFVVGLELFGIWLPILYHALYGFYIWYRGESNLADYPWAGNWMYSSQRWTGTIAFAYMVWHTWHPASRLEHCSSSWAWSRCARSSLGPCSPQILSLVPQPPSRCGSVRSIGAATQGIQ
jgi:succinate dehydrogenase / fumarate reductase, cytochrome b subunit